MKLVALPFLTAMAQACLGLFMSSIAIAETDPSKIWVNVGFYSAHFETHQGLRNPNPGVGVEYTLDDTWSLTAGRFINSDNAHSNYLGAYYQP